MECSNIDNLLRREGVYANARGSKWNSFPTALGQNCLPIKLGNRHIRGLGTTASGRAGALTKVDEEILARAVAMLMLQLGGQYRQSGPRRPFPKIDGAAAKRDFS